MHCVFEGVCSQYLNTGNIPSCRGFDSTSNTCGSSLVSSSYSVYAQPEPIWCTIKDRDLYRMVRQDSTSSQHKKLQFHALTQFYIKQVLICSLFVGLECVLVNIPHSKYHRHRNRGRRWCKLPGAVLFSQSWSVEARSIPSTFGVRIGKECL